MYQYGNKKSDFLSTYEIFRKNNEDRYILYKQVKPRNSHKNESYNEKAVRKTGRNRKMIDRNKT